MKRLICVMSVLMLAFGAMAQDKINWEQISMLLAEMETMNVRAVKSAYDEFSKVPGYDTAKYRPMVDALVSMGNGVPNGLATGNATAVAKTALKVDYRREILLSNPLLNGDKILVTRYKLGGGAPYGMAPTLGTQPDNWSNQSSARRDGFNAEIIELSNLRGKVNSKTIYKPNTGTAIADLQLHWDGDRALFSAVNERRKWNVYEYNFKDGSVRAVIETVEPDLEFFDGAYLPDGRIIAVSNIGYQGVPCVSGWTPVGNMIMYDPKTKEIRRMTFDQDANWHPRVMNSGRLMYVRWEYTDLIHYFSRFVMHGNPDGTEVKALYGSGGWFPNSVFDVQPLPGGVNTFVGIVSGHHGTARSGRLMLFDPSKGRKEVAGITQEIPFSKRPIDPIIKDALVDGVWPQFIKPFPLSDKFFLVTAKPDRKALWGIYLVDVFDNMTLLAEFEGDGLINAIPLTKRPTPPIIPDRIKPKQKDATVFIQDIYVGEGLPGVPRGTVKQLRLFAYEYCYLNTPSDHTAQGVQSGWDIKRPLGTVNVEADGSAMFKVPANTPISIQPLDSEGRAIQWMRSWFTAMPGEVVSCVGCHEDQNSMPIPKRVAASTKAPQALIKPEGGVRPFTYELEIQPILDNKCISCHGGNREPNFTGGVKVDGVVANKKSTTEEIKVSQSYMNLHPFVSRQGPEADIYVMKPYEYHASTSELVKILKRGHHGVELTDKQWRTLYAWIDLNVPYHGAFVHNSYGYRNQYDRRIELANKYANGAGVEWKKETADYAKYLAEKGAVKSEKPEIQPEVKYEDCAAKGFPFDAVKAKTMQKERGVATKIVEIYPGIEIEFVRIPAGKFVMGNNTRGSRVNTPASVVKINKPFWISKTEVTNKQFNVIFPKHDSRFIAQPWKDHTTQGCPANNPNQPVIRISWNEAQEYCDRLSKKWGLNIKLPTEAQWEWACRAGSDSDFWYGDANADFAKCENLADAHLSKMALIKPMPINNSNYKHWNFLPKEESVDDGQMIVCDVASYQPNAWGLYDMHGNVAEWTRSNYAPYPYNAEAKGEQKVIRGGSWIERPKNSTAYTRNAYYPWQPAITVGMRLVIEDK